MPRPVQFQSSGTDPSRPSPLRHFLTKDDARFISRLRPSCSTLPVTSTSTSLSKPTAQPPSSTSPASPTSVLVSHRKRTSHKSPSGCRRLAISSDMDHIISMSKAEGVERWKGLGNERSSREWVGKGKYRSPSSTPTPINVLPVRRPRVRAPAPNATPRPLTNPPPVKRGAKSSAASRVHANNNTLSESSTTGSSGTRQSTDPTQTIGTGTGHETPTLSAAPMTRKRSTNGGGGSAIPLGLLNGDGSGRLMIPPSPLRESSVAVMTSVVQEEEEEELTAGVQTVGTGAGGGSANGSRKRKRPWELFVEEDGASIEGAEELPAKIRRGSEPFTSAKKAKQLALEGDSMTSEAFDLLKTGTGTGKRAATHSPPPSPSTIIFSHKSSGPGGAQLGLLTGRDGLRRSRWPVGEARAGEDELSAVDGASVENTERASSAGGVGEEDDEDIKLDTLDSGMLELVGSPLEFPTTALPLLPSTTGLSAPRLQRVASTDSYGSSSGGGGGGAGRTRRETAIPKALRDYEMKIKV